MQNSDILSLAGLRIDGRRFGELRTMKCKIGFDKTMSSDGSVYFEHGLNKVVVMINGPVESNKRSDMLMIEKVWLIANEFVLGVNVFLK